MGPLDPRFLPKTPQAQIAVGGGYLRPRCPRISAEFRRVPPWHVRMECWLLKRSHLGPLGANGRRLERLCAIVGAIRALGQGHGNGRISQVVEIPLSDLSVLDRKYSLLGSEQESL